MGAAAREWCVEAELDRRFSSIRMRSSGHEACVSEFRDNLPTTTGTLDIDSRLGCEPCGPFPVPVCR